MNIKKIDQSDDVYWSHTRDQVYTNKGKLCKDRGYCVYLQTKGGNDFWPCSHCYVLNRRFPTWLVEEFEDVKIIFPVSDPEEVIRWWLPEILSVAKPDEIEKFKNDYKDFPSIHKIRSIHKN